MKSTLETLTAKRKLASEKLLTLRGQRRQRQSEREGLLAQRRGVEIASAVATVLPDSEPVSALDMAPVEEELSRIAGEEQEAVEALAQAEMEEREGVVAEIPGLSSILQRAAESERQSLVDLAGASLKPHRLWIKAWEARVAAETELTAAVDRLKSSGGSRRIFQAQSNAIRLLIRDTRSEATPEEVLGWLVSRMITHSRCTHSPLSDYWKAKGLSSVGGSILHNSALISDEVHLLQQGMLPS